VTSQLLYKSQNSAIRIHRRKKVLKGGTALAILDTTVIIHTGFTAVFVSR